MKAFLILAHPEPKSFNGAMFRTAAETLRGEGHEVHTSDLHAMQWNPVSDRRNFVTVKDPDYLKLQVEEAHGHDLSLGVDEVVVPVGDALVVARVGHPGVQKRDEQGRLARPATPVDEHHAGRAGGLNLREKEVHAAVA